MKGVLPRLMVKMLLRGLPQTSLFRVAEDRSMRLVMLSALLLAASGSLHAGSLEAGAARAAGLPPQADRLTTGSLPKAGIIDTQVPQDLLPDTLSRVRDALFAYGKGDLAAGDIAAATVTEPAARTALAWAALREFGSKAGFRRIAGFLDAHPGFPMSGWLRRRGEDALYAERPDARLTERFFGGRAPEMATGKVALALIARSEGRQSAVLQLIHSAWRDNRLPRDVAAFIEKTFPEAIGPADDLHRALRLAYDRESAEAMRHAARAGDGADTLVAALAAAVSDRRNLPALIEKVPERYRGDPAFLFAKAHALRRAGKLDEAATVLSGAPENPAELIAPSAWWLERRMLARQLLDAGNPAKAYAVAAAAVTDTDADRIDAAFYAGWIALRMLHKPAEARRHFELAGDSASSPLSLARAAYWRGRASQAGGGGTAAAAYQEAAAFPTTYYGQLALARLGRSVSPEPALAADPTERQAFEATPAGAAIRVLLQADAPQLAAPLAIDLARHSPDATGLAALGDLLARHDQPRLSLIVGKLALQRRLPMTAAAYPLQAIPAYAPLEGSADKATVYAVARQESEFSPHAASHAGARGLMQMMPATARRTAQAFKVAFDPQRLARDPAYNARIGAAHLGQLLDEHGGNYLLAFAAYNAGGGNVKKWIAAFGDPRDPKVDAVDWVERIPFAETRNYVQRVMENLRVYRVRFARSEARLADDGPHADAR